MKGEVMKTYSKLYYLANKKSIKIANKETKKVMIQIENAILNKLKIICDGYFSIDFPQFKKLDYKIRKEVANQLEKAGFSCYERCEDEALHIYLKSDI